MAIRVGRLVNVSMGKRGTTIPATPPGALATQTHGVRFIPPWPWYPSINLLESASVNGARELPWAAVKGAATVTGFKANQEVEPTDVIGHNLNAVWGQDTLSGDGVAAAHAHNFTVLESAILPTYDWWHDEGDTQFGFAAMAANKWDWIYTKGEITRQEMEWTGLYHVPSLALSPQTYPTQKPIPFATTDLALAGATIYDITNLKLSVENQIGVEHTIRSDTNFPSWIWTEHSLASVEFEALFTSLTEYNKYLATASTSLPTESDLTVTQTSGQTFTEGLITTNYKFLFESPRLAYRAVEVEMPTGVVRAKFTGVFLPGSGTIGSGANSFAYTNRALVAQFINGGTVAY